VKSKQLQQFRHEVYQNFNNCKRTDMLMDLVDALSSNTTARSVVELSLNPHFRRHYTALNKAVTVNALKDQQLTGRLGLPDNQCADPEVPFAGR
jgi:hypothetical protein